MKIFKRILITFAILPAFLIESGCSTPTDYESEPISETRTPDLQSRSIISKTAPVRGIEHFDCSAGSSKKDLPEESSEIDE